MLLGYLRISLRYLLKSKAFSAISLLGLTLGFLSFLLVAIYIHDELSYDSFHADADHLYRVLQHEQLEDGTVRDIAQIGPPIGPAISADLPEVAAMAWISVWGRMTMGNDPANRHYQRMMPVNEDFLEVLNFPLEEGDPATALAQPNSIVISEEVAQRYFGSQPAMGQQIWTNITVNGNPLHLQVSGILKEGPGNSHLRFDMLISEATFKGAFSWYTQYATTEWASNDNVTYIRTREGTDVVQLEQKITSLVKAHYPTDRPFKSTFTLQPVKAIHLSPGAVQARTEISASVTNPLYLYSFAIVGILLLMIACLNYLNLSTAAAFQRTREIGARKTLGAQLPQLVAQFAGETLILSLGALVLALVVAWLVLPVVNQFTDKSLSLTSVPPSWMIALVAAMVAAGLASSMYPAFVIARIKPVDALKKDVRVGHQGIPIRKLVVGLQLGISILMLASTFVVYRQLDFIKDKDLGFTLDDLLVIDINSGSMRNLDKVKTEFRSIAGVQSVAASSRVPGEWKSFPIASVRNPASTRDVDMIYVGIDEDFMSTYNISLLEGRIFTAGRADSLKVILTRLAVEQLGLQDPIGQIIEIPRARFGAGVEQFKQPIRVEVIGVAENFHFESFRQQMMPLVLAYHDNIVQNADYYTLRIQTANWSETIERLKEAYARIETISPMEYNFLDDRFGDFYREDEKRGQLFLFFSSEIVLIACLGLFALVSFSVERRTKEISIRKAMGATVSNIVLIIASEYVAIVAVAALVALPLSWYLMTAWLADFAYRVSLGPGVFLLAALVLILIAAITIALRTIGVAKANPVKWLRSE
jgi:putative ABC transport system permease protein